MNSNHHERIAIVNGVRTPFVKQGLHSSSLLVDQLGVYPLKEAFLRSNIRPDDIDDVITGCVAQPAHAANVGRVIALRAVFQNMFLQLLFIVIVHLVWRRCLQELNDYYWGVRCCCCFGC